MGPIFGGPWKYNWIWEAIRSIPNEASYLLIQRVKESIYIHYQQDIPVGL